MIQSPFLTISNISKVFGNYKALDNVSLDIKQGEFISLLGPSGCGKTTLLRIIGGFMQPTQGNVVIDGEDITKLSPNKRPLNTVFQNYALFPHMSVLQNVAYGPMRHGVSRQDAEKRAIETLEMVGLAHLATRRPREMSGGQQQRVALARAIVNKPKLLLLDEPLSALDLQLRKHMQLELKQLQMDLGITFIFVTHDQEEAMAMSDRIAVMSAGKIEQVDIGKEIYRKPKTRFVADFIGDANFLPVSPNGSEVILQGSTSHVGVLRPENLHVFTSERDVPSDWISIAANVEALTYVSGTSNVYLKAGQLSLHAKTYGGSTFNASSTVWAGFDPANLHLQVA